MLKEIYDALIEKRGRLSEVLKIQSLNPATISSHASLYMDMMFSQSPLSRAEREMIAVVVSAANGCAYCQAHHGEALNNYWKNEQRVEALKTDYNTALLSAKEKIMCEFAEHLTRYPQEPENIDFTPPLKTAGLNDRAILDVTLVTAYFNFVNRMVIGLGVQLEADGGKGYK